MSRYDLLKSQVFRCWQKVENDWDVVVFYDVFIFLSMRVAHSHVTCVPDTGSSNRETWLVTDWWQFDKWHQQTIGGQHSVMSVGRADWQQERVDPSIYHGKLVGRTLVRYEFHFSNNGTLAHATLQAITVKCLWLCPSVCPRRVLCYRQRPRYAAERLQRRESRRLLACFYVTVCFILQCFISIFLTLNSKVARPAPTVKGMKCQQLQVTQPQHY